MSPAWIILIVVAALALGASYLAVRLSRPSGHQGPVGESGTDR